MICEYCPSEHDGSFGSGRFCSRPCSRGFSTRAKRRDINLRVGLKQIGKVVSDETREKLRASWCDPEIRARRGIKKRRHYEPGNPIRMNRSIVLEQKPEICEECGCGPWHNGQSLMLQVHHKDGDRRNNRLENLQVLCPNCHTQTDNFAGKGRTHSRQKKQQGVAQSGQSTRFGTEGPGVQITAP